MRLLLFDWHADGHHSVYVQRTADALTPLVDVVVAAPDETIVRLDTDRFECVALGKSRPVTRHRLEDDKIGPEERALFERAIDDAGVDAALHLYSDPIIGALADGPPLRVPTTVTLFFPRLHYPRVYRSVLKPRDVARAFLLDRAVRRWRKRGDALAAFALDPAVVSRWNRGFGAHAYWFPEPPLPSTFVPESDGRSGCIVYGAIAARKGIDRLAQALSQGAARQRVVLAGSVDPAYANELHRHIERMRAGGVNVELRPWQHDENQGLASLRSARCAVLPYHRHCGMSRVLLEAAAMGTPVLVHDFGLLGALVERHNLGSAVDCDDPIALRHALLELCSEGEARRRAPALSAFADIYSSDHFVDAVRAPFARLLASTHLVTGVSP